MPYGGDDVTVRWAQYLDLYLWLQQQVDTQIGRVLDTLATRPQVEANTIVVFTADHGEYGGSHGMRTKGDGLYEEGIRIPFYVRDPSGVLTPDPGGVRSQLTSSVDVAPLILTIASGGDHWRTESRYGHLAERADLAAICRNRAARGRSWIAHTTDEAGGAREQAPSHIVGVRTPEAKAGLYSFWSDGTTRIDPTAEQDREFYDYSTDEGRLELRDQADIGAEGWQLHQFLLETVLPDEVNRPLPDYLRAAQEEGLADLAALSAKE
jgi:arylsulfatase A-like enzyme